MRQDDNEEYGINVKANSWYIVDEDKAKTINREELSRCWCILISRVDSLERRVSLMDKIVKDLKNEDYMNDILREIQSAKDDLGRIWKYIDKIQVVIKYKDSAGILIGHDNELKCVAHYAGAVNKGEELESIMEYAIFSKQGVEEVENTLDKIMNEILEI